LPAPQSPGAFGSDQVYDDAVKGVLQVASDVIHGYDFNAFDYIEILNQADGKDYKISRDDLEKFRTRKVKFEQIVK
jgi:hypothetical protein